MKRALKNIVVFILTLEAKLVLRRYKPKIIAITGSVGKTSTKDAIYTALLAFTHVRKSAKSYNSDFGIPLTILGLPNAWNNPYGWLSNIAKGFLLLLKKMDYPKWLVLEIGADHPGEIQAIMRWVHPDISVITRIGDVPVHVENYKSVKDVVREKSYLARELKKDGFLILNADDSDVIAFKEYSNARVITFGIREEADIRASYIQTAYDESGKITGTAFKVDMDGSSIPIKLNGILGQTHIYPVLASFAVIRALGFNPLLAQSTFSNHEYPKGRMNIIDGTNHSTIIDDTYNASPVAVEEGFLSIKNIDAKGRKIAVIGDMLELGKHSGDEHQRLGKLAGEIFKVILLVGIRAKDMKEAAAKSGLSKKSIFVFESSTDAGEFLKTFIGEGDVIFIKGSQGMRMEKAIHSIMEYPELRIKQLVRQEPEWLSKA